MLVFGGVSLKEFPNKIALNMGSNQELDQLLADDMYMHNFMVILYFDVHIYIYIFIIYRYYDTP